MKTLAFSLATVLVVSAIALVTYVILLAFGVAGSECRYVSETGLSCW